ncbi:MAG: hypothetical protein ACYCPQ_06665 [Elusimicrobiota bacterium]
MKTRYIDNFWILFLCSAAVLTAVFSACRGRPRFVYAPSGEPFNPNGPLFDFPAAVEPFSNLTIPLPTQTPEPVPAGERRINLMERTDGLSSWPRLSEGALAGALADDLAALRVVSTAAVAEDEYVARGQGARLLITGDVNEASETEGGGAGGTIVLDAAIDAALRSEGDEFNFGALHKTFHASVSTKGLGPLEAENEALNRLYGDVAKELVKSLQTPAAQAYLAEPADSPDEAGNSNR